MTLFALKNIAPQEEICFDYKFRFYDQTKAQPCNCGSNKCRGFIGYCSIPINYYSIPTNSDAEINKALRKILIGHRTPHLILKSITLDDIDKNDGYGKKTVAYFKKKE